MSQNQGVGLFFYSGHGARVGGNNYLIPTDNDRIVTPEDLEYYAIDANKVLTTMRKAKNHVNIIILDACRDNPYLGAGKSMERGLARMVSPKGSIIAFATSEGKTASDISDNGRNGLFTSHLIKALKTANQTHQRIDDLFMAVSDAVTTESRGKQEPWQQDSLKRPFCFGGCVKVASTVPVQVPVVIVSPPSKFFRDTLGDGSKGPEMVRIPAGSFKMGSNKYSSEKPIHQVSVSAFSIGKYEVTFAEYDKFANATGKSKPSDQGWGRGNRPVINVSWKDAVAYAKWLSKQTGHSYRLPTEAEWEYAARAGTTTKYWWGNDIGSNKANCSNSSCGDSFKYTAPVGSFAANPFGIYDTVGNVWEWCSDIYSSDYYSNSPRSNPTGPGGGETGQDRVQRGGAWYYSAQSARTAVRDYYSPDDRYYDLGFRLLRITP